MLIVTRVTLLGFTKMPELLAYLLTEILAYGMFGAEMDLMFWNLMIQIWFNSLSNVQVMIFFSQIFNLRGVLEIYTL